MFKELFTRMQYEPREIDKEFGIITFRIIAGSRDIYTIMGKKNNFI